MSAAPKTSFADRLLDWFDREGRHDLPWQQPRSAYRVWLAEVMLQQTQVQTVLPYYQRFLAALPTLPDLAAASTDQVMALWAGLGYYARARHLHRTAQVCVERHGGELPRDFDALLALPGIGRSTAGAILAQAHGERFAILDGNVKRTLGRFHGIDGWPGSHAAQKQLWALSEQHLPETRLADYTQAIMDFGATLCRRHDPACDRCPLQHACAAHQQGRVDELPTARPGKPLPQRHTWMLLIEDRQQRLLMQRRPGTGIWAGLWSLPEAGDHASARHFVQQHSHASFDDYQSLPAVEHTFSHFRLQIEPLLWRQIEAKSRLGDNDDLVWLTPAQRASLGLPAPVKRLLVNVTGL